MAEGKALEKGFDDNALSGANWSGTKGDPNTASSSTQTTKDAYNEGGHSQSPTPGDTAAEKELDGGFD